MVFIVFTPFNIMVVMWVFVRGFMVEDGNERKITMAISEIRMQKGTYIALQEALALQ